MHEDTTIFANNGNVLLKFSKFKDFDAYVFKKNS